MLKTWTLGGISNLPINLFCTNTKIEAKNGSDSNNNKEEEEEEAKRYDTKLENQTLALAMDATRNFRGDRFVSQPPDKCCRVMRLVLLEIYSRYRTVLKSRGKRIQEEVGKGATTMEQAFYEVVHSMLEGKLHWGRIAMIFTLAAVLSHFQRQDGLDDLSEELSLHIMDFIRGDLGQWIINNGGWEYFEEHFREQESIEGKVMKGIFLTAMGLGAMATLMT